MQLNLFLYKALVLNLSSHHMHKMVNYVVAFKSNLSLNHLLFCEERVTYAP